MENFEQNRLTQAQREFLDRNTRGTWSVNSEGLVLVNGDFYCYEQKLKDFLGIQFSEVTGHFNCNDNQLPTLEGAPRKVGGYFYCSNNQLTTLQGSPEEVGADFYCSNNQLTTLHGSPTQVGGDFYCHDNQLTTLQGAPAEVGKDFCCSGNLLVSLDGSPAKVGRNFYCRDNQLTTLQGGPTSIDGCFYCSENQLKNLGGSPVEVGGDFYCHSNQLTTLEGSPIQVGGGFYCYDNPLVSLEATTQSVATILFFRVTSFYYNLESFLDQIKDTGSDEIVLLLTHHFFTVDVLGEQLVQNPDFIRFVGLAWDTEGFKKKKDELEKILTRDIIEKINDLATHNS